MTAQALEETFDRASRDLAAAIGRGDLVGALAARRRAEQVRDLADRSGLDTEEDGGWMVPGEDTVRARVAARSARSYPSSEAKTP